MTPHNTIELLDLGVADYLEVLALQNEFHQRCVLDPNQEKLILCQHPSVITMGRHASRSHLLQTENALKQFQIPVIDIERGGEVTGHEPGQVVAYPIIHLGKGKLMARGYVHILEQSIIEVLSAFGLEGHTDPEHPGIWIGKAKVCAIGIRIKNRVSMHGLALNVNNDLSIFKHMVPCGIQGRNVTSMQKLLGKELPLKRVQEIIAERLEHHVKKQK